MPTLESEKINKIDEQILQLQKRKKALESAQNQKAKKERTRRLIEYGELVEKYLKCETPKQLEEFLKIRTLP